MSDEVISPVSLLQPVVVSTTLVGNDREIAADALRSVVDAVDWCLVVDTGVTDDTLQVARKVAGDKLVVRTVTFDQEPAAAKNFALAAAAELGGDWALMLDVDERVDPRGVEIHAVLAASSADVLVVDHVDGTHGTDRFFRVPARGKFVGPIHEEFIIEGGTRDHLPGVVFATRMASPEDRRNTLERSVTRLSALTAEDPDDPKWFYYLGDALADLRRYDEAIAAFRVCASLHGRNEAGAWAFYRVAECFCKLNRPDDAVDACGVGMAKHAGLAELPWLAAFASWEAGRPAQAVYWGRLAIALGYYAGAELLVPRFGFRHPAALWEGPYDVMRFALRAQGDEGAADEAEQQFHQARAAREEARGSTVLTEQNPL